MTIINDADSLKEVWTVQTFKERYSGKYSSQALVVNDQNPEKGLVTIRAHIEDSAELQKNGSQKFVIAIRFYSFGDMATVDVVSLPLEYHRDIFARHIQNVGWCFDPNNPSSADRNYHTPFICLGGHVQVDDGLLNPFGSSGDYGDDFCGFVAADIAAYVFDACGLPTAERSESKGKDCIASMMELMERYHRQPDFYERFIDYRMELGADRIHPQNLSALTYMRAWDTHLAQGSDFLSALTNEMVEGVAQYAMLKGVQKKLMNQEK
ncbi:hypothetical protein KC866_01660 [Patescibacteria group bacterium]|nr:hypothetical protein [Patescibacteria group bacterium]